jgi:hypothetical protein
MSRAVSSIGQSEAIYRVWITSYRDWEPRQWDDLPPSGAIALELAEEGCFLAGEAAALVEGFNSEMLSSPQGRWAVAVAVQVRYLGDLEPGEEFWPSRGGKSTIGS